MNSTIWYKKLNEQSIADHLFSNISKTLQLFWMGFKVMDKIHFLLFIIILAIALFNQLIMGRIPHFVNQLLTSWDYKAKQNNLFWISGKTHLPNCV